MMYVAHILSTAVIAALVSRFIFKDKTLEGAITSAVFTIVFRVICFAIWPLK